MRSNIEFDNDFSDDDDLFEGRGRNDRYNDRYDDPYVDRYDEDLDDEDLEDDDYDNGDYEDLKADRRNLNNRYPRDDRYEQEDRYRRDERYSRDERYPRDRDERYPRDRDDRYPRDRDERYPRDDRRTEPRREPRRDSYRDGYRDGYRDNAADSDRRRYDAENSDNSRSMNLEEKAEKAKGFFRRHPVMMNIIYVCLASLLFVSLAMWFLDFWTFHGQERSVPDVKNQSFEMAQGNISRAGLRCIVTDSVYDSYARPGTVVEQMPIPNSRIKSGGAVYVTIVAYTPKMVTIPDFYDVSERQARSMLEGLGIKQVMSVRVPSEYEGLVLGARFNGVSLRPGAKVPVTAVITLEVGGGSFDTALPSDSDTEVPVTDQEAIEQTIETLDID